MVARWFSAGSRSGFCEGNVPKAGSRASVVGVRIDDHCGQATKGVWRMSRRQKAMKGVEGCDKLGEAVKQALIPGFPNNRVPNP